MEKVDRRGGVLITGASSGIGEATALRLDSLGFRVFAGVRKDADAEKLRGEASERLTPVKIDVTDEAMIESAREEIASTVGEEGLVGLVNNAGVGTGGPIEVTPVEEFRRLIEINLIGQVAVTHAFVPLLRAGQGRIVFIGSIGGRVASPFMSAYGASKFALEAVSDSLRQELQPWDMWVAIVEPGMIATEIWGKGSSALDDTRARIDDRGRRLYGEAMDSFEERFLAVGAKQGIPPQRVAKAVEHALTARRPKTRYLVGRDAKMSARMKSVLSDRALERLQTRMWKMPRRGAALEE